MVDTPVSKPWAREDALKLFKMYEDKGWAVKQQMVSIIAWVTPIIFGLLALAAKEYCATSKPEMKLLENLRPLASLTASLIAVFMGCVIFGNLRHAEMDYHKADEVIRFAKKLNLFPTDIQQVFELHAHNRLPGPFRFGFRLIGDVYAIILWVYVLLTLIGIVLYFLPEVRGPFCTGSFRARPAS